jgi:hypothetical protein
MSCCKETGAVKRDDDNRECGIGEDGDEGQCCLLWRLRFCTYRCWTFFMSCLVSLLALAMAFVGLLGGFQSTDTVVYWNLITFVVGVWIPSPRLKPANKRKATYVDASFVSSSEGEDQVTP